ncbi:MAG: uroporphyrinogen-III synthase [Pseudomonadota bacterium]
MSSVLVIQPLRSRRRLLDTLHAAGRPVIEHSFITIEPIDTGALDLTHCDAVIWVSKNAVLQAHTQRVTLNPRGRMYAVGPGTARLAAELFNLPCQCPVTEHASESLLNLPELIELNGQRWAILKGKGGRELLANSLVARGASLENVVLYQRVKKPLKDPELVQRWISQIDTIVVTSAEQLSYFLSELPKEAATWLQRCHWVVPSQRLAQLIPFAKPESITITQSASENAMINALTNSGT